MAKHDQAVLVGVWWLVLGATTLILLGVLWLRMHALLVLLAASLLVAVLTPTAELERHAADQMAKGRITESAAASLVAASPPKRLATAFGQTAGEVGILIALASIVGVCLLESGAAAAIVAALLRVSGVKRAAEGLAAGSFILSIPVFFDTVFYLMIPLARSLRQQTGRDYVLYILAIMAGGAIAHSLVPPTPGPLQVAEILGIEIFPMIVAGLAIGSLSSFLSLLAARVLNHLTVVPLRDLSGESPVTESQRPSAEIPTDEAANHAAGPSPPLATCLLPIVLPVLLIGYGAVERLLPFTLPPLVASVLGLLADKNVAMGVAAIFALHLLRYSPQITERRDAVSRALASGGQIILITSAGGALGAMLRQAGIAAAVSDLATDVAPAWLLVVVFLVTAAIRTLQGSATVAMITAAGVLQGLADVDNLPFHPVYVAMAIGVGSKPISWMTDSGFWIMCKMSGMTDAEGLRTVSVLSIAMGLSGLLITLAFATLFPAI